MLHGNSPVDVVSSIRAELLAHGCKAMVGFAKQIPIDVLFKIEKVAQYLEGKDSVQKRSTILLLK